MLIKAVFHIDETIKWNLVINNINNLIKDLDKYEIELVANSEAVIEYLIKKSSFTRKLHELSKKHVKLCACKNALNENKIRDNELFDFVKIVPVGVKEIIEKQVNGYAYIKP